MALIAADNGELYRTAVYCAARCVHGTWHRASRLADFKLVAQHLHVVRDSTGHPLTSVVHATHCHMAQTIAT